MDQTPLEQGVLAQVTKNELHSQNESRFSFWGSFRLFSGGLSGRVCRGGEREEAGIRGEGQGEERSRRREMRGGSLIRLSSMDSIGEDG